MFAVFVGHDEAKQEQAMSITTEFDLEGCLAALDCKHGKLPEMALRWAQANSVEITPRLIRSIEEAMAAARAGNVPKTNGHFFAFCLLTEFQAPEAWPTLLAAMRLPGELPADLFGDLIHGVWVTAIRSLASDRIDEVFALIRDPNVNEYVRWSAVGGLVQIAAWELRPRDEVVGWFRTLLLDVVPAGDLTVNAGIICELCQLWPGELIEEIRAAYDRNLIDDEIIHRENVENDHAEGLDAMMKKLIAKRWDVDDTVEELRRWASFSEPKRIPREQSTPLLNPEPWPMPMSAAVPASAGYEPPVGTIRHESPRVGRNDPCPCGSGKKFKKCCGPASSAN